MKKALITGIMGQEKTLFPPNLVPANLDLPFQKTSSLLVIEHSIGSLESEVRT